MKKSNYELNILVDNKPIQEYHHTDGNTYIEGRKGSEFKIQFKNNTKTRVLANISVDGLSVMNGEQAGVDSGGYIVDPWGTIEIPGWRLDNENVANFVFETAGQSYAAKSGKGHKNTGVIGVLVFEEKLKLNTKTIQNWLESGKQKDVRRYPFETEIYWGQLPDSKIEASSLSPKQNSTMRSRRITASSADEKLGTGFGKQNGFNTYETTFDFKDPKTPDEMLVIYYDSVKNLEKRGIQVFKQKHKPGNPNPFPNMTTGCTPPPGWQK